MVDLYSRTSDDTLSLKELELYKLLMDYRDDQGLPDIPLSKALTTTAGRHAADTVLNVGSYVGHSWSDAPYDSGDRSTYDNMWSAPERLGTGYRDSGYEISTGYTGTSVTRVEMTPEKALSGWQSSQPHDDVILNNGIWSALEWNAIGVGMRDGIAHVWFAETRDKNVPQIKGSNSNDKVSLTRFDDKFDAKKGDDHIKGLAGDDTIRGQNGDDTIKGGNDDDLLRGSSGNDVVRGNKGSDVIIGGRGNDTLDGGNGPDRFVFSSGDGNDTILGFRSNDVIDLRKIPNVDDIGDLTISRAGSDVLIEVDNISIRLVDVSLSSVDASDFLF